MAKEQYRASYPDDQTYYNTSYTDSWLQEDGPRERGSRHTALWAGIMLICVAVLCVTFAFVYRFRSALPVYQAKAEAVFRDTFAQGIFVDNVDISGMTRAQAERALAESTSSTASPLRLSVRVDDAMYVITENQLPFERNIAAVLDTAYAIGRQGIKSVIGSGNTLLDYRYEHLMFTQSHPAYFYTTVTYDRARLRGIVAEIESVVNREAKDAMLASFDFSTRSFTFTEAQEGRKLDSEQLYNRLIDALECRDYNGTIFMETAKTLPNVTKTELMNNFCLVSKYYTTTTSNTNRNINIDLACQAVSGTVVMPGETFSFNQATGERTYEKGYREAAAIQGGTTVDEIGGGVCQVSSTLFNAAAMANLTILDRYPHAWPSSYVDKGRDATVNWPNLDFRFRNDGDMPVFLVTYYSNRTCTAEIYGKSLGNGVSISLETELVSTSKPPSEPVYTFNPLLEKGTQQIKKEARTGYEVETFRVWKQNGQVFRREWICNSIYKMVQAEIEYNN